MDETGAAWLDGELGGCGLPDEYLKQWLGKLLRRSEAPWVKHFAGLSGLGQHLRSLCDRERHRGDALHFQIDDGASAAEEGRHHHAGSDTKAPG
jgi:hypothetical protein